VKHGSALIIIALLSVAPYFIGVFDTVAALGARGFRRFLIEAGLTIGIIVALVAVSVVPAAIVSGLLHVIVAWPFWCTLFGVVVATVGGGGGYFWSKQHRSIRKTIRDYPKPGDVRTHYAEWRGENFDRLLSRYVHYARSANAIVHRRLQKGAVG
jgi:hypothetical protein